MDRHPFEAVALVLVEPDGSDGALFAAPGQLAADLADDRTADAPTARRRRTAPRSTTAEPAEPARLITGPGITSPAPIPGQQTITTTTTEGEQQR